MQGDGPQEEADYRAEQEAEAQAQGEAEEGFQKEQEAALKAHDGFEREIKELKVLRENAKGFQEILKGLQVRFAEKHKNMIHSMAVTNEAIGKLEASIKTKALNQYNPGGEKKLAFGVGIQERKEVFFDDDLALAWATEKGMCLKLDVTAFKKIAKVQDIKWTYIGKEIKATIPTDIKI